MSWASIGGNQHITCNNLQDAVTNGIFSLVPGQTIPASLKNVTTGEVNTWITYDDSITATFPSSKQPIKDDLLPGSSGYGYISIYNYLAGLTITQIYPYDTEPDTWPSALSDCSITTIPPGISIIPTYSYTGTIDLHTHYLSVRTTYGYGDGYIAIKYLSDGYEEPWTSFAAGTNVYTLIPMSRSITAPEEIRIDFFNL